MTTRIPHARSAVSCAISLTLLAPALAAAQSATTPTDPAASAAAPAPAASEVVGLETVVVTAQKIKENLQKVPLSITAINAEALGDAGVKNILNLQSLVTGVNVVDQGPGASVQIRGVGSNPGGGNVDPSVAFSVDGVYQSRSGGALGSMFDLQRVEVLKGPQGTLYGRNATVGAMNVISNNPGNRLEGSAEVELGNYNLRRALGIVNIPVNDVVRVRAAVQRVKRDGYLSDGYNDADDTAGRLKIAVDPTSDLSILFTLDGHLKHGNGQGNIFTGTVTTSPINPFGLVAPGVTFTQTHTPKRDDPSDPWHLTPNTLTAANVNSVSADSTGHAELPNQGLTIRNLGFTTEINQTFSSATLTIIPAYRTSFVLNQGGTGGNFVFPAYNRIDQDQKSLEVRLASDDKQPLRWIGGYFFMDENAPTLNIARAQTGANTTFTSMTKVNAKTNAVFGQATYALQQATRLTAGLRYTRDTKDQIGSIYQLSGATLDTSATNYTPTGSPLNASGTYSSSSLNYKVGIDKDLSKDAMVYASVSTGYKSGGLNFDGQGGARQVYSPEKLLAFAVGNKFRGMDNRLQLNTEAFLWKYKDQQTPILDVLDNVNAYGGSAFSNLLFINNPGTSTIYGIDVDAIYALTPNDRINGTLSYLHARNGQFVAPQTTGGVITIPRLGPIGAPPFQAGSDLTGKVMPFSPTWQLNLGYSHIFDLASGAAITVTIDGHLETESYVNYNLAAPERQPGYFRGNFSVNYSSVDSKTSITGYVRNFTNVAVLTRGSVLGSSGATIAHYAGIMDPRTYGVVLTRKF